MSSTMKYKVTSRKNKEGAEYFEGTVALNGLKPTKLQKSDGCTQFSTKSAVGAAARSVAKRLGVEAQIEETAAPARKAAKKSVKATKSCCDTQTSPES